VPGFCPREKAERVRNCAALPRDFVDQVVLQVANLLLDRKKFNTGNSEARSLKPWNGGGRPAEAGSLLVVDLGLL
jgi:tRNASer (uridine44-2'-O)-methyltransferase